MAVKLQHLGNEVMMFTYIHQYPELFFPGSDQKDNSLISNNLPTRRVITPYNPLTWLSATKEIKGWKPDLIIIQHWLPVMALACGFVLSGLKGVEKCIVVHNAEAHEKWPFSRLLTRFALMKAEYLVTLSETCTLTLRELLPKLKQVKIIRLFHPVYENMDKSNVKPKQDIKFRLLFFGFIKHYKGLDILLHAMPLVIKHLPDIKLVIAGDIYGDKQEYLEMIEQLGISNNVEAYFKYIPEEEIDGFFANADVSVIPYRSATQSGVAQLSFSHEVPIIATRVGGLEEVIAEGKNGWLIEPENPAALADAIISFYNDNKSVLVKDYIRQQNSQFSWDSFTEKFFNALK
jgi:glycosyltransferase involved in cell wall biosynthesis